MAGLQKILILGGSGFIGRSLAAYFSLCRPDWAVDTLSLPEADLGDRGSQRLLATRCDRHTTVIFLAATKRQFGDTLEAFHRNLAITENVGLALAERKPARVVFFSSAAVYGEETHDTGLTENSAIRPQSFYGLAKFTGEKMLEKILGPWATDGLLCLRPPLVYGPGDVGRTYGPSGFCASALAGEKIRVWGDGTELREFLHVRDLCGLVVALLESGAAGTVNAAFGRSHSFCDVLQQIERILGRTLELEFAPRTKTKADNRFDPSRLRALLGDSFQPTSLKDGLLELLQKRNKDLGRL